MFEGQARIGVDVGGTFTDAVLEVGDRRFTSKVLTTPRDPEQGCMQCIEEMLRHAGLGPDAVGVIVHGTTLATNSIIERKGATTSLLTTEGFRDTLQMGTEGRPDQYDINVTQPEPLVPRRQRITVEERLNSRGEVLVPLTTGKLDAVLPILDAAGTESLAIAFLHSYANPVHERLAREHLSRCRPDWSVSLSCEVSPEFREFERFSTTCANAYVRPLMERYLTAFAAQLRQRGFVCPLLLMLSSGGLTTVEIAKAFPVRLVESGPAGGAIFAQGIAAAHGIEKAVSFDMGGTTAKICLIDDTRAQTSRRFEVARVYRFRRDSGLPLRIPVIEMVEIGAGGGSIAGIDALGRIAVGPQSAGSDPGPACYGLGGRRATVTDANLVMGRIDPEGFAGGRMALTTRDAQDALMADVGQPMSVSLETAAFGVTEIVCENMATAVRVHAIESGKNVDDRTLIAFGGAAPLHACQLARKLGIRRIIVPRHAGVGSAVGFLRAPISYEVVRTFHQRVDAFEAETVNTVIQDMEDEAKGYVRMAAGPAALSIRRQAYMRYQGQGHEIAVDVPNGRFDASAGAGLQALFDEEYRAVFGRDIGTVAAAEVVAWRVTAGTAPFPDPFSGPFSGPARADASRGATPAPISRPVLDPAFESPVACAVHDRETLESGFSVSGPAILAEDETSTVVDVRFEAAVLPGGDVELRQRAP
ncbi:MAG: hydantoinase/oxoprolinase family protein [Thiotrichales bacterium]|nr:hydantoinase/oxoprolinase family protein [Thiotrichales bacterium]